MRSVTVCFLCLISHMWLVGLLTILPERVASQPNGLLPFFQTAFTGNPAWSADSQIFAFGGGTVSPDFNSGQGLWYAYDVNTGIVTQPENWPLQPSTNVIDRLSQYLAPQVTRGEDFVYLSPNGQFLIAAGQGEFRRSRNPRLVFSTVLADVETNQVIELPLAIPAFNRDPRSFQVKWSDDSRAFTLGTAPALVVDLSFFTYVSGYADDHSQLLVRDFSIFNYGGREYNPLFVYDVSSDGSLVLIQGSGGTPRLPIFVWDVRTV